MTRPTDPPRLPRRLVAVALAVVLFAGDPLGLAPVRRPRPRCRRRSATRSCSTSSSRRTSTPRATRSARARRSRPAPSSSSASSAGPTSRRARSSGCACSRATGSSTRPRHVVVNEAGPDGAENIGFVFPFYVEAGFPAGDYYIEVDYNRVPDEVVPFTVGDGATFDEVLGPGAQSGPDPLQEPVRGPRRHPRVRAARTLGSRYDAVAAAAARGRRPPRPRGRRPHPGHAGRAGRRRSSACCGRKPYKYLLILGNDDAVPYFRVENPLGDSEERASSPTGSCRPTGWPRTTSTRTSTPTSTASRTSRSPASRPRTTRTCCSPSSARTSRRRRRLRADQPAAQGPGRRGPQHGRQPRPGPAPVRAADDARGVRQQPRRRERPLPVRAAPRHRRADQRLERRHGRLVPDQRQGAARRRVAGRRVLPAGRRDRRDEPRPAAASSRSGRATGRGPWTRSRSRSTRPPTTTSRCTTSRAARGRTSRTPTSRTAP